MASDGYLTPDLTFELGVTNSITPDHCHSQTTVDPVIFVSTLNINCLKTFVDTTDKCAGTARNQHE